jgi:prevent-host-death family protein
VATIGKMKGRSVATAEARRSFRSLIRRVRDGAERVKVTRYGKTVVGIIPAKDLQLLEECERARRR